MIYGPLVFINNPGGDENVPQTVQPGADRWVGDQEPRGDYAHGSEPRRAGGGVNDDIIAFYEARARGGIGHIVEVISGIAFSPMAYQTMYSATKAP